ncbi:MAG: CDP-alcohol phosphatidyltransferase family protein [Chlamydiota bacterium]
MLDSKARNFYDKWITAPLLSKTGLRSVAPGWITLFGCVMGVSVFFLLWLGFPKSAVTTLMLSGVLDTLDGAAARHQGKVSDRGAILDIISDRLVEFGVILGLFATRPLERGWLCMLMLGSVLLCITSFLVVGIFSQNTSAKSFHYSPGLMERTEAFGFFAAMILFPSAFSVLSILFSALVLWTASTRIMQSR